MSASSRSPDRFATTFDHEGLVANAGLILAGTLMARLGLLGLIERWVRTGSANPGPKICAVVAAMLAGATHIDHVGMLRAGRTGRVLGFRPLAPSTVGSFLRTFTFGYIRQLEAVLSRTLARAWGLGAGPGKAPLVVDVDSTICEVHGKQKQGAAYGYTKKLGYHPLLAARADTGEVLGARMRKGSAGSSRGVVRFVDELAANLRRAGAAGPVTVRGDSGFWSWKLIDRLDGHDFKWSITVALIPAVRTAIQAIPATAWADIAYTKDGHAQVAETQYTTGSGKTERTVRLVVRRTRLTEGAQRRLWPDWRHHAFNANTEHDTAAAADEFHRATPWSSSPSATSKKAPASSTSPQATTERTAHRSPAPCSPTTSATGPPPSLARRRPRTAPAAPDSSHSPPCSSTDRAHPPCDTPPAGPGKHNSEPHSTLSGLCPDPPAKQHSPELTPPHKPSVDNPEPHPHPYPNTPKHTKPHPQQPRATPTRHRPGKPTPAKGQSVDSGLVLRDSQVPFSCPRTTPGMCASAPGCLPDA